MSLLAAANSTSWEWLRLPFDWVKWGTALSIPHLIHTVKTKKKNLVTSKSDLWIQILFLHSFIIHKTRNKGLKSECLHWEIFFFPIVSVKTWWEAGQTHSRAAICKENQRSVNLYEIPISDANHVFVPHNFASVVSNNS